MDGFFEWKAIKGQKAKQPYAIAMKDGSPFGIGGLWENWRDPTSGEWLRTFAIITTDANELVAEIHDRMPLILAPGLSTRRQKDERHGKRAGPKGGRKSLRPGISSIKEAGWRVILSGPNAIHSLAGRNIEHHRALPHLARTGSIPHLPPLPIPEAPLHRLCAALRLGAPALTQPRPLGRLNLSRS